MEFGSAIKKIRHDKNMTQKETAFQIVGRSYLSLIEGNKYFPSLTVFIKLLNRLSITYDEFIYILNDNSTPYNREVFIELSLSASSHNLKNLKKLEKEAQELYLSEGDYYLQHISLLSKSLRIYYENNNTPSEKTATALAPIKEYLLSCSNWYLYEMKLFNNSMFAFTIDDALFFSKLALKKIEHYSSFTEFQNSKQHMLLNLSTLLIAHKKYELAYEYSKKALEEANTHLLLYEKILSKLNLNICLILLNKEKEQATLEIKKLLDMLPILDLDQVKINYENILGKQKIIIT
ncbi:hypothetical protein BAU15_00590 [Enterococcus sp. JM4C]|uniref:helix-turn-helix domain-containing protein n=1 Tax=Candidatus Enterococcus huntleyi TaxID=1857217 RepID=UPI00137A2CFC|nr:Rgg/GadR/MutR family transcriptional regulator [Enterococcus sp. JM4C]KAF1299177.1 hypothetical protein BAU15_00590 [Enterococcus sp. JM4C]